MRILRHLLRFAIAVAAANAFLQIPSMAQEQDAQEVEQRLQLEQDARMVLEALAVDGSPYQSAAEDLLDAISKVASVSRGSGAPPPEGIRETVEADSKQLYGAVARANPNFAQIKGFRCLDARSICELRGHSWFDCELTMIVCMYSDLSH